MDRIIKIQNHLLHEDYQDHNNNIIHVNKISSSSSSNVEKEELKYPFHLAIPVHNLQQARIFYGEKLKLPQGRSASHWIDYNLYGHQLVVHKVSDDYRALDLYNPVDRDYVPVPHFGCALTVPEFHELVKRVEAAGIEFFVYPHIRFPGLNGEQWTCFFKDPSGNSLEFKAMSYPKNLFVVQ